MPLTEASRSTGVLPIPDPGFRPGPVGSTWADPVFGGQITRITDAAPRWAATEYSTVSPWNCDGSRFLLVHVDHFGLYQGLRFSKDLPIGASQHPRWTKADPDLLYYHEGNRIMSLNVATGVTQRVAAFGQYGEINFGGGEGDDGGQYLAVIGDWDLFRFNIATGRTGGILQILGKSRLDSCYVTPNGNMLLSWTDKGAGEFQGVELRDGDLRFLRNVVPAGGHHDVCRDKDGREVLIWTNSDDAGADTACQNGQVKVDLASGETTCLLSLAWILATHTSRNFVETYSAAGGAWVSYRDEILRARLDGSGADRLCHHRSTINPTWSADQRYLAQPKATVRPDGKAVLFASNMANPETPGVVDVYLLTLDEAPTAPVKPPSPSTRIRTEPEIRARLKELAEQGAGNAAAIEALRWVLGG